VATTQPGVTFKPQYTGALFGFTFRTDDDSIDFSTTPLTIYMDPPLRQTGASRITLASGTDGTVAGDGLSVAFSKNQAWTTALVTGDWDFHICVGPHTAPLHEVYCVLPVVDPRAGAFS